MSFTTNGTMYPSLLSSYGQMGTGTGLTSNTGFNINSLMNMGSLGNSSSLMSSAQPQMFQYSMDPFANALSSQTGGGGTAQQGLDMLSSVSGFISSILQGLGPILSGASTINSSLTSGITGTPSTGTQSTAIDYDSKQSVQDGMSRIANNDPTVKGLYNDWLKMDPATVEGSEQMDKVFSAMQKAGYSPAAMGNFDYLQNYYQNGTFSNNKTFEDKNPVKVDKSDQKTVQKRMAQLASKDSTVNGLYKQWLKAKPQSAQYEQLNAKMATAMGKANYPESAVKEFFQLEGKK